MDRFDAVKKVVSARNYLHNQWVEIWLSDKNESVKQTVDAIKYLDNFLDKQWDIYRIQFRSELR